MNDDTKFGLAIGHGFNIQYVNTNMQHVQFKVQCQSVILYAPIYQ